MNSPTGGWDFVSPFIIIAIVVSALVACSQVASTPSASIVPKPKAYSCDFAMKLAPQLEAAPKELQQFVLDAEKLRYANSAARGEPDPVCHP